MYIKILLICLAIGSLLLLTSFNWPIEKKILITTFGQNIGEGFNTGINLSGKEEDVLPIAEGDIIFYYEENGKQSSLPYGLGSFVVMYHEGGIQSCYAHLKKGSISDKKENLGLSDKIGVIGSTGASIGSNLSLIIFNIEENEILNPIKNLIPYFSEKKKPIIKEIFLKREGKIIKLDNNKEIPAGKGEILIKAYDQREDVSRLWELSLYKLSVTYNGKEVSSLFFDSLSEKENELCLSNSKKVFSDVYYSKWVYKMGIIDFLAGKSIIQIRVWDFARNIEVKEISIIVRM